MFELEIRTDWFYETRHELHLRLRVKSSSTSVSSRWSGCADLTLSIFQCLTVRSPIWT